MTPVIALTDIRRWDTGSVIPGTEGIAPGPGVQLDFRQLDFADLRETDLNGASFRASSLASAFFYSSTLTNASFASTTLTNYDLSHADLTDARLQAATLTDANLTDAIVMGTAPGFVWDTSRLYTTGEVRLVSIPEPSALLFSAMAAVGLLMRRRTWHRSLHC